ncbi:MAG: photosynthetic reaction center subunit H [Rhodospirillales bacterium]|jgi:photosynthetic reaction center H subunit
MEKGSLGSYLDVAQVALYVFWAFFAALIYYLHRENKREGYPLESDRSALVTVQGFPPVPKPKTYLLHDGSTVQAPRKEAPEIVNGTPIAAFPGAPIEPNGDPMTAGVGPGAWARRADTPDMTADGRVKIVPLRADSEFSVAAEDPDPRGFAVVGADGAKGGTVVDAWVDRSEVLFRYFEVDVGGRTVLLPVNFSRVDAKARQVKVASILGSHFAGVPAIRSKDSVTMLEEEKVMAYYGAGTLYATPSRAEPLL